VPLLDRLTNVRRHQVLLELNICKREAKLHDSTNGYGYHDVIRGAIKDIFGCKFKYTYESYLKQKDSHSCGIWVNNWIHHVFYFNRTEDFAQQEIVLADYGLDKNSYSLGLNMPLPRDVLQILEVTVPEALPEILDNLKKKNVYHIGMLEKLSVDELYKVIKIETNRCIERFLDSEDIVDLGKSIVKTPTPPRRRYSLPFFNPFDFASTKRKQGEVKKSFEPKPVQGLSDSPSGWFSVSQPKYERKNKKEQIETDDEVVSSPGRRFSFS